MRVIGLFNGDVAAVDMIAKLLQPGGVIGHEVINGFSLLQTAVGDLNGQLHNS